VGLRAMGGLGSLTSCGTDSAQDAQFNQPCGITVVGTNLYVAEQGNNTIREIAE
jgi:hypothetical protein